MIISVMLLQKISKRPIQMHGNATRPQPVWLEIPLRMILSSRCSGVRIRKCMRIKRNSKKSMEFTDKESIGTNTKEVTEKIDISGKDALEQHEE